MPKDDGHEAIRSFMERAARGEPSGGRKMKYDPRLKRFVVVDETDSSTDDLPEVTPEDLQSFGQRVVLHEAGVSAAVRDEPVFLRLEVLDGGDVWRIDGQPGGDVALVRRTGKAQTLKGLGLPKSPRPELVVLSEAEGLSVHTVSGTKLGEALDPIRVPTGANVFHRTRGVFETDALATRRVGIVGVGSGGSFIANELAKSGVGHFVLVDHDRLEVGNVCRHECGLSDVGRLKVHAVADRIRDHHPDARVKTHPHRVTGESLPKIRELLSDIDVLVIATDNRESRLLLNRVALTLGIPTLFGAVFRRAYGGQVLRLIPELTPCYQCFVDALPDVMEDQEISSPESAEAIAYSDRPVAVEPGLSTDLLPVALLVVKLAQLALLGKETTLAPLRDELVAPLFLWVNRREPGTDYAELVPFENNVDGMSVLRWYGIYLPRNPACPACGSFEAERLGDEEAIHAEDLEVFATGGAAAPVPTDTPIRPPRPATSTAEETASDASATATASDANETAPSSAKTSPSEPASDASAPTSPSEPASDTSETAPSSAKASPSDADAPV